ncbi:amidase family protein [Clavibacter michiganensis]|uniref:amidase family protein n=1 Tax=Clavibacter michiganensis TaxID=28447 RepID=UPI0009A6D783|nr:amidase family protein [Clavibacter michiganensis]MBF4638119.1 amidase [Clavibacter michiganensis subsp. michiganensis]MDO4123646.1 amidase family protein [Clavibacter michiganensis]MDO4138495.1 amidase family protein [Clavibacter michiganensis]MWJ06375.1 amidase [Clavibacter michiganensis subsp. michiganensis]MWJ88061.1 amidase [Clavibacter michiganensis subsp. michiganensis]
MPARRRARDRIRVGDRALATAALAVGLAAGGGAVAEPARASTDADPAASASPAAPAVVDLGVADAVALLDAGSTTSVELTRAYLARIDAYDDDAGDDEPGLKAVITTNPDALATAATLDAERAAGTIRGPLHGVPIVVKDNHATADMPTTVGSAALRDYRTTADSTAVARLRAAGAIILAKTNMSEFAWHGTYTLGSARGRTANPYDRSWSASGSSGGTAAAVAASYAPAGLGTDSCGSILGPAAHQSLVGFRPTMGLTSTAGIVPLSPRQDVSGPMTTTVADAALLTEVLAGRDPADPLTEIADQQATDAYVSGLSTSALAGKRIGWVRWDRREDPERPGLAETSALMEQAVRDLEAQGAEVVEVPLTQEFVEETLQSGGWRDMRPAIDRFLRETPATWPARVAARTAPADVLSFADVMADRPSALTDGDIAYFLGHEDVPNPDYDRSIAEQDAGKAAMDAFFVEQGIDALAMPTSATSATPTWAGTTFCDIGANTGIPTISVPAGFTSTGAPVGLELAAPRSDDGDLLAMTYAYEQATRHRVAPGTTPELVAAVAPEAAAEAGDEAADADAMATGAGSPGSAPQAAGAARIAGVGVNTLGQNAVIAACLALVGGAVMAVGFVRRRRSPGGLAG